MLVMISENTRDRRRKLTEKIQNTSRVAPLVVIPGDELDKVVVESNAGLDIEDGGMLIADQIGRDDLVLGVCENTWLDVSLIFIDEGRTYP